MVKQEIVKVMVKLRDRFTPAIRNMSKGLKQFNSNMTMSKQAFATNIDKSGQLKNNWDKNQTSMGRFGGKLRMATRGMKDFKMEMLGVMFFGMAMQRMFSSLLRPALDTVGVFELWTETLRVFFLPVVLAILPAVLGIMDWLMNMSDSSKMAIGAIVLFGLVLATLLFVIGTVALGIGSLATALGVGVGVILSFLGIVMLVFAGVIMIVKGIVDIVHGDLKGVGYVIIGIGLILALFIGWWALIPIAVGIAVVLIISKWSKIKGFFRETWRTIKLIFLKALNAIMNKLAGFYETLGKLPGKIGAPFRAAGAIVRKIMKGIGDDIEREEAFKKFLSMTITSGGETAEKEPLFPKLDVNAEGIKGLLPEKTTSDFNTGEIDDLRKLISSENKEINITNNISTDINNKLDFEKLVDEVAQRISEDVRRNGVGT